MDEIDPQFVSGNRGQEFNSVQFQLDASEELRNLKAELLGLEWNDQAQDYVRDGNKLVMVNVKGANAILTFLKPRINKIISLSNKNEEDIMKRCKFYIDDLTLMLVRHHREFEVVSCEIADNIIDLCDDIFNATALKSIQGWEGDGIRKQQSYVETKETVIDNKSKGFQFPIPFSFNKNK